MQLKKIDEGFELLAEGVNYKNLTRHIQTGSKIYTKLTDKTLKIIVGIEYSAPPLTTKDVESVERHIFSDLRLFLKDVMGVIDIKNVELPVYIHVEGLKNAVNFAYHYTLTVGSASEGKKLALLDDALSFYKK